MEEQIVAPAPIAQQSLPGPFQIFSEAWNIYTKRFGVVVGIYAVPILLGVAGMVIFAGINFLNPSKALGSSGTLIGSIVLIIIAAIAAIYVYLWASVSLIIAIKDSEENIDLKESFKRGRQFISPYFNASVASGLITILGFILFIIPGIIWGVWYAFAGYLAITDKLSYGEAIKRSKQLVKGRWWPIFGRLAFVVIMSFIINFAMGTISALLISNKEHQPILSYLFSILWTPFLAVYGYLLYAHIRRTAN